MMHIKIINRTDLKKAGIAIIIVVIIMIFIKCLPLSESVQAFSIINPENSREDICKTIIDKTIPMLDVTMNDHSAEEPSQFIAYTLLNYITRIDFKNPRTYLLSEIPLLGLLDITTLNVKVGGASSSNQNESENKQPVAAESKNFQSSPAGNFKVDPEKPEILIYHTHTTESFTPTTRYNYEAMGDHRTTDRNYNICRLGEEIKNYMETYYGIAVMHDMTLHDYPSYDNSYNRSKPTVENLIKKYPDIKYIIDVHRDAFPDDESARKNMVVDIRGEQAAKIMFVIGKSNPHWQENYYMTLRLNQKIEELYPGLSKGILARDKSIYNQDISNKSILIEVGADCNTMEETLVSAKMVARAMGELLKSN